METIITIWKNRELRLTSTIKSRTPILKAMWCWASYLLNLSASVTFVDSRCIQKSFSECSPHPYPHASYPVSEWFMDHSLGKGSSCGLSLQEFWEKERKYPTLEIMKAWSLAETQGPVASSLPRPGCWEFTSAFNKHLHQPADKYPRRQIRLIFHLVKNTTAGSLSIIELIGSQQ